MHRVIMNPFAGKQKKGSPIPGDPLLSIFLMFLLFLSFSPENRQEKSQTGAEKKE